MKFKDLGKRLLVAAFGIPAIITLIYLGKYYFLLFVLFISLGGTFEFISMMNSQKTQLYKKPMLVLALMWPLFLYKLPLFMFIGIFWIMAILWLLISFLLDSHSFPLENIGLTMFGIVYTVLFPSFLLIIREQFSTLSGTSYISGAFFIFFWVISIWICDTAAYFGGSSLGRHKLAPGISPNKTIEGFLFGLAGSLLFGLFIHVLRILPLTLTELMTISLLIGIAGQVGDLVESRIKRLAGVKDSSNLLPGHGGVLDRFDSIIFTTPLIFTAMYLIF